MRQPGLEGKTSKSADKRKLKKKADKSKKKKVEVPNVIVVTHDKGFKSHRFLDKGKKPSSEKGTNRRWCLIHIPDMHDLATCRVVLK